MPRKATRKPAGAAIRQIRHVSRTRKNPPTDAASTHMSLQDRAPKHWQPNRERRRRARDPFLQWDRGEPDDGWRVPGHPLYIQEKVHPCQWIRSLTRDPNQEDLFGEFNGLPEAAKYRWYDYEGNWSNRLIRGESSQVMASLIEREGMRGAVQMIYFDPPYGCDFKGNFQTATNNRDTAEKRSGLPNDTPSIQAFRDTYERGVDSYLDMIHRNLELAWELLADSGSLFLQIGNDNMMRLGIILDEVFGSENRMAIIPFRKTGTSSSKTLPQVCDYLLWYAKNKKVAEEHYHQLYENESDKEVIKSWASYAMVELPDKTERGLTKEEKENPELIPKGARLFQRSGLTSQGWSTTGRSEPYEWRGKTYECKRTRQWAISHEGLDRLAEKNRLVTAPSGGELRFKIYREEQAGTEINNMWAETMSPSNLQFVVETAESVVARCILMTTKPGDLVLDPTCGSGTTAYVAEQWGRRWITMDTSAVAIALARRQITTATMDYYVLQDSKEGSMAEEKLGGKGRAGPYREDISHGFVYERVPYVSPKVLGYNEEAEPTMLVNKPVKQPRMLRVASPFTVESSSPQRYLPASDQHADPNQISEADRERDAELVDRVLEALTKTDILVQSGKSATKGFRVRHVQQVEVSASTPQLIQHIGACAPCNPATKSGNDINPEPNTAIVIAPDDVTVPQEYVRQAIREIEGGVTKKPIKYLIMIGFAFEPTIEAPDAEANRNVTVIRAQANRDLMIEGLAAQHGHAAFVVLGDIEAEVTDLGDNILVEVKGFQTYDPAVGNLEYTNSEGIHCWIMDTNYDGHSFMSRDIHFVREKDPHVMDLERRLKKQRDPDAWNAMISMKSVPFSKPETGMIAIKVITISGNEMIKIIDIN